MKVFKILRKYLEKFGPRATIWANGPLQFSNSKTGPGLGQTDSAQAHSGPNPKNGFTKARARPGQAWAWPELIPIFQYTSKSKWYFIFCIWQVFCWSLDINCWAGHKLCSLSIKWSTFDQLVFAEIDIFTLIKATHSAD